MLTQRRKQASNTSVNLFVNEFIIRINWIIRYASIRPICIPKFVTKL